jgi:hypothetical protein
VELSGGEVLRKGSIEDFKELGRLAEVIEIEDEVLDDPPLAEGPENEANTLRDNQTFLCENPGTKGKLIELEARAEGRVSWRTYLTYIRAAGIISWIFTILLMLLIRVINIGNQVILWRFSDFQKY